MDIGSTIYATKSVRVWVGAGKADHRQESGLEHFLALTCKEGRRIVKRASSVRDLLRLLLKARLEKRVEGLLSVYLSPG